MFLRLTARSIDACHACIRLSWTENSLVKALVRRESEESEHRAKRLEAKHRCGATRQNGMVSAKKGLVSTADAGRHFRATGLIDKGDARSVW